MMDSAGKERITALHEAGHTVFAMSSGVLVELVSIEETSTSLGHVQFTSMPRPHEADCRPDSLWMRTRVKFDLAGDRAVRVAHPFVETVGGGLTSDYLYAVRLVEAVAQGPEVVAYIDALSRELDEFFARPDIWNLVVTLADMLQDETTIAGDRVRRALFDGKCAALHPDGELRCVSRPHRAGYHSYLHRLEGLDFEWVDWDGFDADDRTLKSKRTPTHRRVLRIVEPDLYPPRHTAPKIDDLRALLEESTSPNATPHQRHVAFQRAARLVADRYQARAQLLGAPAEQNVEKLTAEARHRAECGATVEDDEDSLWCSQCGFESHYGPSKPRRWLYIVSHDREVYDADDAELPAFVAQLTVAPFITAEAAASCLKLTRETNPAHRYSITRWPLPRPTRTKPNTTAEGRQ